MAINLNLEQVKTLLKKSGHTISNETRTGNNLGTVLKLSNGCIINCWDKGTVNCQGKNAPEIDKILSEGTTGAQQNNKVFVVYGHDKNARTQLEAMLRRWDLEPLILDQLPSDGGTIIEKLEKYTKQADFGIVLATPDDIGYAKNNEIGKKYRVRQRNAKACKLSISEYVRQVATMHNPRALPPEEFYQILDYLKVCKSNIEAGKRRG